MPGREIRLHKGEIDEVVAEHVDVHLERMDEGVWSLILYDGDQETRLEIFTPKRARVNVTLVENDLLRTKGEGE